MEETRNSKTFESQTDNSQKNHAKLFYLGETAPRSEAATPNPTNTPNQARSCTRQPRAWTTRWWKLVAARTSPSGMPRRDPTWPPPQSTMHNAASVPIAIARKSRSLEFIRARAPSPAHLGVCRKRFRLLPRSALPPGPTHAISARIRGGRPPPFDACASGTGTGRGPRLCSNWSLDTNVCTVCDAYSISLPRQRARVPASTATSCV